ncbi:BamA/TamA family outer membrane protein [Pedobacter sp.]|jgi:outer membrane protein insertion porin family|uniref:translocation and assembly module lipoprotein TamL n=1 Tax=Pedobacter sp. TaxID=1411316 RepID=UPI002D149D9B|nr:BamA/TamA family outer membrane protein [Pedobacter sp.]HWW39841.1 BamA/TamA family outer membrane protein [Pedobacter sp.]
MKKRIKPILCILSCLIWAACSSTKGLKPGEILYTGAEVKINPDSSVRIADQKEVKSTLEDKTRPTPNKSILGIKYKLGFYNLAGEPKKPKGFRHWLRTKMGEPPVLLSQVKIPYNNAVLKSYLISQGYLQSDVMGDTVVKGKKGKAVYTANTGIRYKINSVSFPPDSSGALAKIVNNNKGKTLLKPGNNYDLDVFKNERIRIDNDLKENGYFYFSPDYLILQVDSTVGKQLVDIRIRIKEIAPDAGLKPYTINNINIYPNYSIRRDSALRKSTPSVYNDFKIYDPKHTFKDPLFNRLVFFKKGELYNRKDHSQTLNRLVNIGVFQSVKAEFIPLDSFKNDQLDLNIFLTPLKKNSLTFSVTGTSKSNNFMGSEVKVTQTTRNLFRGAEQLDLSASGGFETQVGGQSQGLNSFSLTGEAKLTFPRFITPFKGINSTNAYIPKTIASLTYQRLHRGYLYDINSFKAQYGYKWNENQYKEHAFNPISVNYVTSSLTNDTTKRDSLLNVIPGLRNVIEKQFIIGSNYSFTYTNQFEDYRKNNIYFNGTLETGGNVWGLFAGRNSEGKKAILGQQINQYVRMEADFRDYYKLTRNIIWANRIDIGYGYAYGNQTSLPFVRQFFAGGTNDIRAWAARSIGPGTYYYKNDPKVANTTYVDQSGDIKALISSELRFKLAGRLYGALFADAGNVWLRKEDLGTPATADSPGTPSRPGSGFDFKNALSEFAVGTGAGLRVDASIFVIRLDVAFPVRKPYNEPGKRWVFNEIDFGDSGWRKDNLVYNIGIGYPF